jgi:Arc/MetJ-type ribon-helix-helix transcriptional regulator
VYIEAMKKPHQDPGSTRKSVTLPDSMWREIGDFRYENRIGTQAEAIRRLLHEGLKAARQKGAWSGAKPNRAAGEDKP